MAALRKILPCASLITEQLQQFRLRHAGANQSPRWPAIEVNCAAPLVVNSAGPVGNEPARINEIRETGKRLFAARREGASDLGGPSRFRPDLSPVGSRRFSFLSTLQSATARTRSNRCPQRAHTLPLPLDRSCHGRCGPSPSRLSCAPPAPRRQMTYLAERCSR